MSTGRLPSTDGGIQPTVVDAKGDLLVGVAADSVSRLAVGSNDQVLTADSSTATGLKWGTVSAGAYTSITSGTLSSTSVVLSSIAGTYRDLRLVVLNPYVNTATPLAIRINGSSVANYGSTYFQTAAGTLANVGNADSSWTMTTENLTTTAPTNSLTVIDFKEYANSTGYKTLLYQGWNTNLSAGFFGFGINTNITAAITSVTITTGNGTSTFSGGTYVLYGVK